MKPRTAIFVLDDDESVCRALSRLLQCAGHEVRGFSSPKAFLDSLANGQAGREPDCALIDVQMPGMNGLALHQELLRRGSRLPVIFMTAHDVDGIREQAIRQGAKAYLVKPFTDQTLLQAIMTATPPRTSPAEPPCERPTAGSEAGPATQDEILRDRPHNLNWV